MGNVDMKSLQLHSFQNWDDFLLKLKGGHTGLIPPRCSKQSLKIEANT